MATKTCNVAKRARIESFSYLNRRLRYDADTGVIYWKILFPDRPAGAIRNDGSSIKLALERLDFKAHRIAWVLYTGQPVPAGYVVDHINGNPLDNRIANLRLCTQRENSRNCKTPKNSTTALKGVSTSKGTQRYRAYIAVDGKQIHLGMHDTPEQAHAAYRAAAIDHFGEYAALDR